MRICRNCTLAFPDCFVTWVPWTIRNEHGAVSGAMEICSLCIAEAEDTRSLSLFEHLIRERETAPVRHRGRSGRQKRRKNRPPDQEYRSGTPSGGRFPREDRSD